MCHNRTYMARIKEEDLRLNILINGDKARSAIAELSDEISKQKKQISALEKERKAAIKQYGQESSAVKKLDAALAENKQKLAETQQKHSDYQRQLKLTGMTMSELSSHMRKTKILLDKSVPGTEQWKKLNAEMKKTKERMDDLKGSSSKSKSAIAGLAAKGAALVAAIAVGVRTIGKFTEKIIDFEQANANLSTVLGKTIDDIKVLTDEALRLGRNTEYTASQVTSLQMEFAKLGFSESQIIAMTEPTLNFATAIGTDLPSAAKMAGSTLRIFGLNANETKDALSVLAVAADKSSLDFSYLETAMSTVGPVAKTFGLSLRDTTTLLGTLANAGFDASSAATATRNILLNLANSSGKLAKALGEPVHTFPELMDGLKRLKDMGVDLATTLELTDKRSVAAFNTFLDGTDSALELRDALDDVDGELERIASERLNTVRGSLKLLQSAWEGFILAFSNSKGIIKQVIDGLTTAVTALTEFVNKTAKFDRLGKSFAESALESAGGDYDAAGELIDSEIAKYEGYIKTATGKLSSATNREKRRLRKEIESYQDEISLLTRASIYVSGETAIGESPSTGTPSPTSGTFDADILDDDEKKWSLENDKVFLVAKNELMRKYNEGHIRTKEEFDELLFRLEVSSLTARLAANKEKGKAREKIEADLQSKILNHKQKRIQVEKDAEKLLASLEDDKTKIALEAEERRYRDEKNTFEKNKSAIENHAEVIEAIERKHQNNLLKIQLEKFDREQTELSKQHEIKKMKIQNLHGKNIAQMVKGSASEAEELRRINFETAKTDEEFLLARKKSLETFISGGHIDGVEFTDEQRADLEKKLQEVLKKLYDAQQIIHNEDLGLFQGTGGSLFGISDKQWEQFFIRIGEGTLRAEDMLNVFTAIGGVASEAFGIAQLSIKKTNAEEEEVFRQWKKENEEKKQELRDRLAVGLISQAQHNAELGRLQAEQEAKKEELELKQARRSKALAVTQSIFETAVSVMKTFTQFGGWPGGIAPAAIMAGIGAAKTALISSTPVTTGAAEGGKIMVERRQDRRKFNAAYEPTRRGFINRPTVLVGEEGPEYVIPAEGLKNPSLAPILKSIEAARRRGTLRNINFDAAYPAFGYAGGGLIGRESGFNTTQPSEQNELLQAHMKTMRSLDRRLRKPLLAYTTMLGDSGIAKQTKKYNELRNKLGQL